MTKLKRTPEGFYDIKGRIYEKLRGTRRQVYDYRTAYKTAGGLTRKDLVKNKAGRIVSKAKFDQGPTLLKNLTSRGFYTRKGKFGAKKKGGVTKKNKNAKKMKKQKGGMDTELKKLKEDKTKRLEELEKKIKEIQEGELRNYYGKKINGKFVEVTDDGDGVPRFAHPDHKAHEEIMNELLPLIDERDKLKEELRIK
jgi:gas vesicle protein